MEDTTIMIIAISVAVVATIIFFETLLLYVFRKQIIIGLKHRFGKGRGYNWLITFYKNRTVDLNLTIVPEIFEFDPKDPAGEKVQIGPPIYRELGSGIPVHVIKEGNPNSLNLEEIYKESSVSKQQNLNVTKAFQLGKMFNLRLFDNLDKYFKWIIIGNVIIAILILIAIYFSYQNGQAIADVVARGTELLAQYGSSISTVPP